MLIVADIMTTEVFSVRSSAKVTQAIALMQAKHVRSLIVEKAVQSGAYGLLTERDIVYKVTAQSLDPDHVTVGEIMHTPCLVVSPSLTLNEIAKRFEQGNTQRAAVVVQNQLIGIVSVTDIVMKSNVSAVELPHDWAERVEVALRHKQLCWGDACELEAESRVAYKILTALQPEEE